MARKSPPFQRGVMDRTDYMIIEQLDRNSRLSNMEIARKLGISEGTVRNRIRHMLGSGLIRKFTIEFGVKRGLKAFVLVHAAAKTDTAKASAFLRRMPQVKSFYHLAGRWDMILRVFTESSHEFNGVIDKIRRQPWVLGTEGLVVLEME